MVKLFFFSWSTTAVLSALVLTAGLTEGTAIARTNSTEHHAQVSPHGASGHHDGNASLPHTVPGHKKGQPLKDGHANMSHTSSGLKKKKKQVGVNVSMSQKGSGQKKKKQENAHASLSQTGSSKTGSGQKKRGPMEDWADDLDFVASATPMYGPSGSEFEYPVGELRRKAPSTYETISSAGRSESSWATRVERRRSQRETRKLEVGSEEPAAVTVAANNRSWYREPETFSHGSGIASQAAPADITEAPVSTVPDTPKAPAADHTETLMTMVSESPKVPVNPPNNVWTVLEIAFGKYNLLAFSIGLILFTFVVVFLTACWGEVLKLSCRDKTAYVG